MSITPQSSVAQRPTRKRRKPRPPIAQPDHFGYFARIPLPWILRPAWQVEVEDFVRHGGGAADLCDGHCWWVVVHQMAPGFRYRVPFSAPHHLPTEAPEREARRMFKSLMKGRA